MQLPKAQLEHWMRDYYFDTNIDMGSSGVATFSFGDLCQLLDIKIEDMHGISFDDSKTLGSDGLRQAIADQWGDGNAECVMTANGSNEMLYHIMSTLLEPEDEVILLDPIYHALSSVAETKGCNVKYWKLKPENNFRPDFSELKALISSNTKMVAVNFPHNPIGVSITREQQKELIKIVSETGAYLVWDAAFEEMTVQPLPNPHLEYEKAISVGTMSKGYGLPGIRIGWAFAPAEIIEACLQLRDYTTLYISPLVEFVGQKAIENADTLLKIKMADAYKNQALLEEWIKEMKGQVEWSEPMGGVTCLVKFNQVTETEEFCRKLADATGVMLVPGECFNQKGYIRLGFGASCKEFTEGLKRVSEFLKGYSQ